MVYFCVKQKTAYELRISDWSSDVCSSDLKALKRKSVRGLSIGYETIERKTDPKRPGINLLEKLELWEVSVVNFPANRRSLVTGVKASLQDGNLPSLSEFEDFLREAG